MLKAPGSRLVRWRLLLEEYEYEIVYKQGKLNQNADALSRIKPENTINEDVKKINSITRNRDSYSSFLKEMKRKPILFNKLEDHNDKRQTFLDKNEHEVLNLLKSQSNIIKSTICNFNTTITDLNNNEKVYNENLNLLSNHTKDTYRR